MASSGQTVLAETHAGVLVLHLGDEIGMTFKSRGEADRAAFWVEVVAWGAWERGSVPARPLTVPVAAYSEAAACRRVAGAVLLVCGAREVVRFGAVIEEIAVVLSPAVPRAQEGDKALPGTLPLVKDQEPSKRDC